MPESETEDETLARIEAALQKIAGATGRARADGTGVEKLALVRDSLDGIIAKLREALAAPKPREATE